MGILRSDRVSGLGGANAINGSVFFGRNGVPATASGNWLTVYSADDFSFGTGDFTIEAWIYYTGVTSGSNSGWFQLSNTVGGINNSNTASAGGLAGDFENGAIKGIGNNGWFNGTVSVTAQSWIHVALVRHSGTLQWFVNGAADTSASDSQNYSLTHLAIGGYYTSSYLFSGYISNFRIVKGTAVYSAAFTPPSTRLTAIDGTVLLACQSPGNILQEATGKTLDIRKVNSNDAPPMASRFTPNSPVGFSTTTDVGSQYGITFEDNTKFDTLSYMVPPSGNTRERGRGRGLAGGGWSPSIHNQIYSVEIASDGSSADFGDLTMARRGTGAVASHTRGIWGGGYAPQYQDRIDFVTIASTGNAIDFGNLDTGRFESSGVSNDTRGVYGPSENPAGDQTVIQYITMATAGNATDFGDSTVATKKQASMNSTTRGIFAGGQDVPSPTAYLNIIDYITTATTGNATDFGDLTQNVFMTTGVCDSTRGVRGGGAKSPSPANTDVMDYVTIASTGNAIDYGDLTTANQRSAGMSNSNRGLFSGGATPDSSTSVNSIDKITIQTTGNAVDFGDYVGTVATQAAGCSDSHGGLS